MNPLGESVWITFAKASYFHHRPQHPCIIAVRTQLSRYRGVPEAEPVSEIRLRECRLWAEDPRYRDPWSGHERDRREESGEGRTVEGGQGPPQ